MVGTPPPSCQCRAIHNLQRNRFIEFFVPGIIAMAVHDSEPVRCGERECGAPAEGVLRSCPPPPSPVPDWSCRTFCTSSISRAVHDCDVLVSPTVCSHVSLHKCWLPVFVALDVIAFVRVGMNTHPRVAKEAESAAAAADALMFPMMFLSGPSYPVEMMRNSCRSLPSPASLLCERGAPGIHGVCRTTWPR